MRAFIPSSRFRIFLSAVFLSASLGGIAQAQLNEKKIERDATGVYTGKATGGLFVVTYDSGAPGFSFGAQPGAGKVRIPVKDGKLSSSMNDNDMPGSGAASMSGKEQKSKVTQGGKKIAFQAVGTLYTDEGTSHGPWEGAKLGGDLKDKGSKWTLDMGFSAYQRNKSNPLNPPDHTRSLTGRNLSGAD